MCLNTSFLAQNNSCTVHQTYRVQVWSTYEHMYLGYCAVGKIYTQIFSEMSCQYLNLTCRLSNRQTKPHIGVSIPRNPMVGLEGLWVRVFQCVKSQKVYIFRPDSHSTINENFKTAKNLKIKAHFELPHPFQSFMYFSMQKQFSSKF